MPEKLKDRFFTSQSLNTLADRIKENYSKFEKERFLKLVQDHDWKSRELKDKMRHTTTCLYRTLPENYERALNILTTIAHQVTGFEAMVLPDYVECYGLKHLDLSFTALKHFTQFSSSEFAIRPFLKKYPEKTMEFLTELSQDDHENVRRFASEGCRPRLPWAMALPEFKKDPQLIFTLLEKLKDDTSEFVRRSVANNLNDISKDNPDLMLDLCEKWYGVSQRTDWIVKHACRSQLKAGNKRALLLFGYQDPAGLKIKNFTLDQNVISIGEKLQFSFQLMIPEGSPCKVRLEFAIGFMKARGKKSRKVFKITEKTYQPGIHVLSKYQQFQDLTTRKHYPGEHTIAIVVNGQEMISSSFELKK